MKIRNYRAYTTHSLTGAIEMYSELVRRMKQGDSLEVRDHPGIRIKVDDVWLHTYKEDGKFRYYVSVIGPIGRSAKAVIVDDMDMLNKEKENENGRI